MNQYRLALQKARASLVSDRRKLAAGMEHASASFGDFVKIQAAIDAVDKAISDEQIMENSSNAKADTTRPVDAQHPD